METEEQMKLQLVFPIFVLWQLKRVLWRWTSFVITTEVKVEISCSYNQLYCPVHIFEDDKNIFSRERSYRKPCGCCPHYNRASNESCQDICVLGIGNYIRNTPSKSSTLHEHEMPFNEFHDVKALKNDYYHSLVIR